MLDTQDRDYYLKRAAQEEVLAKRGSDSCVKAVHRRLADEYRKRAGGQPEIAESAAQHVASVSDLGQVGSVK